MGYAIIAAAYAFALLLGMLILMEGGRRIGARRMTRDPEGARAGLGAVDGAVFGLMGLLVAFTFSGAAARFDARRQLVVEETNAIGTAYLRLDLLRDDDQSLLRENFRRYLDARISAYQKMPDIQAAHEELARATALQGEIWTQAVAACRTQSVPTATILLLPALNQMIDITTTRFMATQMHPPAVVFAMLAASMLASSLLAGYGMAGGKTHSWLHMLGFAAIMAIAMYVIFDIEYPRLGLIRVDAFDQALVDLRQSMG